VIALQPPGEGTVPPLDATTAGDFGQAASDSCQSMRFCNVIESSRFQSTSLCEPFFVLCILQVILRAPRTLQYFLRIAKRTPRAFGWLKGFDVGLFAKTKMSAGEPIAAASR